MDATREERRSRDREQDHVTETSTCTETEQWHQSVSHCDAFIKTKEQRKGSTSVPEGKEITKILLSEQITIK